MEYALHDAASAEGLATEVFEVYAVVFGADGGFEAWRESPWERHRARTGFRLATARDGGRLVGFGWGCTGHRGEYWPDLVAEALPGLDGWVGGHFELVELAVLEVCRGRGAGRRLLDVLLDGLPLLPDAAIDDGLLDVVILHPRNFFSWIPLAWRVLLKLKHTDELVNRMTGASVVVRAGTDTPRQLDGDSIGPGRELRMQCVHGRLLVRVPR